MKSYTHMLFIAELYDHQHQFIDGLIYDDSQEAKGDLKREMLYHRNQQTLRKMHLDTYTKFHMLNSTEAKYDPTKSTNQKLHPLPIFYQFDQFSQQLKKLTKQHRKELK